MAAKQQKYRLQENGFGFWGIEHWDGHDWHLTAIYRDKPDAEACMVKLFLLGNEVDLGESGDRTDRETKTVPHSGQRPAGREATVSSEH
jgi:hypothetical protein